MYLGLGINYNPKNESLTIPMNESLTVPMNESLTIPLINFPNPKCESLSLITNPTSTWGLACHVQDLSFRVCQYVSGLACMFVCLSRSVHYYIVSC